MFKTNKDRLIIGNSCIEEWDIASGNTSIMRAFNLLTDEKLDILEKMHKKDRVVFVGMMMKKNPEFSKSLEAGFNDAVKLFCTMNQLEDFDILSIKRDAVFVVNHDVKYSSFYNGAVIFVKKNTYTGYLNLDGLEHYFKGDGIAMDVKGISDEKIKLHEYGMTEFLNNVMTEYQTNDKIALHAYIADFIKAYKEKELPLEYYRQYDSTSMFQITDEGNCYLSDSITEQELEYLDINYNLKKVMKPLLQILLA